MSVAAGMAVLQEMFDAKVDLPVAPRGRHDAERAGMRHGRERGSVELGGRREVITWTRMRGVDGAEVPLESYRAFATEN